MAELHVEKKSRGPAIILWIVTAVVAVGLAWLVFFRFDGGGQQPAQNSATSVQRPAGLATAPEVSNPPLAVSPPAIPPADSTAVTTTAGVSPGAITEIHDILGATSPAEISGRRVQLTNVPIQQVFGKSAFAVGLDEGHWILATAPPSMEGKLSAGQMVTLTGTVKPLASPEQAQAQWSLPPETRDQLQRHPLFLEASDIQTEPIPAPTI